MAVSKQVLGMNARNFLYITKHNRRRAKIRADDKLETKRVLLANNIPTPQLLHACATYGEIRSLPWGDLPEYFVVKPARGYGGNGIMVIRKWDGTTGRNSDGEEVTIHTLEAHMFDILDGAHSIDNLPDIPFIEDRVFVQSGLKKMSAGGVPDIRIIVYHRVPIMAMMRLPTKESQAKANLHAGALGIGIDLRTGITTKAIQYERELLHMPDTRTKVRGIKIPQWDTVLDIAARTQDASGLGYAGVDIVIDEDKGPLVLEVNARPGLAIQLANGASLRTRLERVDELQVPTVKKGVELAKQLFAESKLEAVEEESNILEVIEKVQLIGNNNKHKTVFAKIDTGAFRTAIDEKLVAELGFEKTDEEILITAGSGEQVRKTATVSFKLRGKHITTTATYLDRSHMKFPMIVGRRDLKGFLVSPKTSHPDAI